MSLAFRFKLLVQYLYQRGLQLFEAIYSPKVVGSYNRAQETWSNFSHEVVWPVQPALYKTPASEAEIVEVGLQVMHA